MRSLVLCTVVLVGCGGSADMAGTYSTTVTNGANSCPGAWTVGDASNVMVDVAQDGPAATLSMTSLSGFFLDSAIGASEFDATVAGEHVNGALYGTVEESAEECKYVWKAVLDADITGDALQGTITYSTRTNQNPDCTSASIQSCSRTQDVAGSRAPQT